MMNIKRLDHIGIRVTNLDAAIDFYRLLGFRLIRNDVNEHVAVLKHGEGVEINLLNTASGNSSNHNVLMDIEQKHPGYTHYALEVESVNDAKAFLEANELKITEGPVTFGDGKTSIFIRDLDRNVIELTQLPSTA